MQFIQELKSNLFSEKQVKVLVLRIDLIHPLTGGNKYFKLKYTIEHALKQNKKTLLSFGGAYSNHIAALAEAGKHYNINTIGIIRGNELNSESNSTLKRAQQNGMKLYFIDRKTYRNKTEKQVLDDFKNKFDDFYLVPEGGSNAFAVKGCMEIKNLITSEFDTIICASGTGGTIAGIALSLTKNQQAIGIPVLKNANFLYDDIEYLQKEYITQFNSSKSTVKPMLQLNYHFGGYAKTTKELENFKINFEKEFHIPLDKIYTSKMMFAVFDLIKNNYFKPNSTVVTVHSGGLQYDLDFIKTDLIT